MRRLVSWAAAVILASGGLVAMVATDAVAAPAATTHPIPGGPTGGSGVTVLCYDPTGFSCAGGGYEGTKAQIGGNGWAPYQYWEWGSQGPGGTRHNCTTYAAYRLQQNGYPFPGWTDNATGWAQQASEKNHVSVDQTPAVGAIAQWNKNSGHVAYVEAVTATYIDVTSDSYGGSTYAVRIDRTSPYMPDNFLHFRDTSAVDAVPVGSYHALAPTRILDTRAGVGAPAAAIPARGTLDLQVTGAAGIPTGGVAAVVLNLTVTAPTASGYLTAYPAGAGRPLASTLNFRPGDTRPNLAIVPIGTGGKVTLYNGSAGTVQLIADTTGYYRTGAATAAGELIGRTPIRILDTRAGIGAPTAAIAAGGTLDLQVSGAAGVPASGIAAVVLNLTVTAPTASGYLTAYPAGTSPPLASNLNFHRGQTRANLAIVPLGTGGRITLYNGSAGTVQLVADTTGYYVGGASGGGGEFTDVGPTRILDTRAGIGAPAAAVPAGGTLDLQVSGIAGIPTGGVAAVVLNLTVTDPTATGYLTAYPAGTSRPVASNLNFLPSRTRPNLAIVPIGTGGKVTLYNGSAGTVQLIADTTGYFAG